MHANLFLKAQLLLQENIVEEYELEERIIKLVADGKLVQTAYDGEASTDELIRERTGGKAICLPFGKIPPEGASCPFTGRPATHMVLVGKSL